MIDSSKDSDFSDSDLTSQLRDKIRLQAKRLRSLERYRFLCEKKIQEIIPGHPLPITKEHLGKEISQNHELKLAKDKIARLENQLSKQAIETEGEGVEKYSGDYGLLLENYNELLKDKNDLEESLRAEMLNSEEQNTYIELLKEIIESRNIDFDGMSLDFRTLTGVNNSKININDSKREQIKLRHSMIEYEAQIKKLNIILKEKEFEIENLINERHDLDSHLQQAAETLQIAEEEVAKLEDEKNSMLDYINQHNLKENDMENEFTKLNQYCEEMQKNFHDTLFNLDLHRSNQNKYEIENENFKEEIYKFNQLINEQKSTIENLQKINQDKENNIKELKQDKINSDLKLEKLQMNSDSLSNNLKELQVNSTNLQEQLDSKLKQDSQKNENFNQLKSEFNQIIQENNELKDKVSYLQGEVEATKNIKLESEKQIQEYKIKALDLQAKNDLFENLKKLRNDYQQKIESDAKKISQLEKEVTYLHENFRDIKHKEFSQSEALNKFKSHTSSLNTELNGLYIENESLQTELENKSKDLELYISKFNHLNEYYASLEHDKVEIEELFAIEINNNKILKEQVLDDKSKTEAQIKSLNEKIKDNEYKLKEYETELTNNKQQLKLLERNIEEENLYNCKLSAEIKEINHQLHLKDHEIEKLYNGITDCCKIISAFCGKCTIAYHDYRSCFSTDYKEFLNKWKEGSGSNIENINSWINNTIEEIQNLSKLLFQRHSELEDVSSEFSRFTTKFEEVASGEIVYKQHAMKLKSELDEIYQKYDDLLEHSQFELNSLKHDNFMLKSDLLALNKEKFSLHETLRSVISENQTFKNSFELAKTSPKSYEEKSPLDKNKILNSSRSLNTLSNTTVTSRLPNEINDLKAGLESIEKEKNQVENEIKKFDADFRSKETENYKNLIQKLAVYDKQIQNYKNKIQEFAKNTEVKNSASNDREKIRKSKICTLDHPPNSCPYLHLINNNAKTTSNIKNHFS